MTKRITPIALSLLATAAWAGGSGWERDLEKALEKAQTKERLVLVEFTDGKSSDAIDKRVFHTGKFKAWARKSVVLVEIDYSRRVSEKLGRQYEALKSKYKVEAYPTVLLLDSKGKAIATVTVETDIKLDAWLANLDEVVRSAGSAGKWLTDWEEAKKIAKRTMRPMLVDFTGSDW